MSLVVWIILSFLLLKVIWNLGVPYQLLVRLKNYNEGDIKPGISLSLEVEIILLLFVMFFSWLSNGDSLINKPLHVLAYAGGLVLFSYAHFFIVGMVGGWLITYKSKR